MNRANIQLRDVMRQNECLCAALRTAARTVTRLYNKEMRDVGIEATQYTMLQILERVGALTQAKLGELLAAEKTTVSRNLKLLVKKRWIEVVEGEDRRERIAQITELGKRQLGKGRVHWERAQGRMKEALTPGKFQALRELLGAASEGAVEE